MKRKTLKELKLEIDKVCLTGVDRTLFQSNSLLCFKIADTDSTPMERVYSITSPGLFQGKNKTQRGSGSPGLVLKPNQIGVGRQRI